MRDLLKWASRLTQQCETSSTENLALEGYFVLGERSRNEMDKKFIKETIEKVTRVSIDERGFYESYFQTHLALDFLDIPSQLNLPRLIPS